MSFDAQFLSCLHGSEPEIPVTDVSASFLSCLHGSEQETECEVK